jgi:AcrR family transcriptional regulator
MHNEAMTLDSTLGRRERKKLETRRALREAALRLFAERGFEKTTIEDITDAADVSPRTFFLHFSSKEDVLLSDTTSALERISDTLAGQADDVPPVSVIRAVMLDLIDSDLVERKDLMLRVRVMQETPALRARNLEQFVAMERLLREDVARRTGRDAETDLGPAILAAAAMTSFRVAMTTWFRRGGTDSLADLLAETYDAMTAGLSAD